jgi:hypothetical protein
MGRMATDLFRGSAVRCPPLLSATPPLARTPHPIVLVFGGAGSPARWLWHEPHHPVPLRAVAEASLWLRRLMNG